MMRRFLFIAGLLLAVPAHAALYSSGSSSAQTYNALTGPTPEGHNYMGQVGPGQGAWTDRSTTITTGGTSQQLMAANASRKALLVQNPCSYTESIFINFTAAASTTAGNSVEIRPCNIYEASGSFVSTEVVNVTAATTGHQIIAKEGQ